MSAPIKFYLLIIISIHLNTGLSINQNDLNFAANFTKPKIIHSPSDVFSTDGVLEFTCQASGYPKPQVVWYDADTGQQVIDRVPSSGTTSGIHVNQHYGKLLISSPERGKLYSFYCNASNSAGWVISQPPVRGGSAYISSQFQQIPVEKTVHEGDRVVMECSPPLGIPEVKVYWLKNKHLFAAQIGVQPKNNYSVITDTNSNTEISPDGSLQISSVTIRDTGTYTCVASNLAGEQISPSAYLLVKTRTRFLETPVDVRVKKGRDVKLRCRVEGNQVVKWKRGHGEDPIDPNRAELTENYLLIKNIQVSDAGTYICTAPGGVEADAIVTVDSPPAFSVTPDDLTVNEGEIAVFHCVATGYPMPAIYWELPDKTPIFPGDQTVHGFHNGKHYLTPDGTLEVRDVKQSDSGKYQCTAHSSIDTIHTSAVLHVTGLVKKKLAPSKNTYSSPSENQEKHQPLSNFYWLAPIIGLPPANQTRRVGDIVTLHCELGMTKDFPGSLPPTSHYSELSDWSIGWYRSTKDGSVKEYMDSSSFSNDRRYTLLPGGSLQIIDVQEEDSGNYTCFAKAVIKPYTDDHLTSFTLQSNWTSHLNIVPLGSMVSNSIGSENPLPQPRNLRATNVTASTVILVWEPSLPPIHSQEFSKGYSSQITYWVELYRPDRPADGWVVVEQNWHAHTVQLGGLQPDTAYYFLIRPRWDQGRVGWASAPLGPILTLKEKTMMPESGELSDAEYFQSVKDINLLGLHLYPLSTKRVRVSWSITEIPQVLSKVTGYSIYSKEVPLMQCISTKFDPAYSDTVEVATRNKDDMYCSLQPNSPTDSYSLYKKLENMQNLYTTNQNSTANSWTVNDIKARYPKNEKYSEIQHPVTYQESGLLRDLEAFRCYSVKVKAYSLNSIMGRIESSESNSVTVLTYESFPSSPPERIFAVWLSNTTIELSWEPPHVNSWNGLLTGYIIYVYDEDASNHKSFNLSYTEQKTLIKGLTGKTTYFLQMAAVTCKGIGVRSVPIQLRPNLRKKGLGVGWGFDLQTGKLLQFMNLDQKNDNKSNDVIGRPWFIVTIICSLLVWCATVALITFCCRHQRYRFRKSAGNVHVTPNSQCGLVTDGSNNIFSSTNNPGTESKCSKNSHPSKKDQVQMEPLLRPESPTNENDNSFESMETGKYPGWRPYPSNTQNQSHYSINTNNRDSGSRDPKLDSCNPSMLALSVSPCTSNGPDHIGLYATAENLTHNTINTMNSNQNIQPNRMQTSHFIFQGATPLLHVPNGCNSRSSYLNYQHHLIPQSQMNTTLPNTYNNFEQSFLPGVRLGSSGLPLVAPVAQIDSLKYNNNANTTSNSNNNNSEPILSSDRINGFNGPSLTVAPYATASIIQNAVNNMNSTHAKKSCTSPIFYTPNNALFSENAKSSSEFTYELDEVITPTSMTTTNQNIDTSKYNLQIQHLQTPQMLYTDYANGCSRTNNIVDEENDMNSEFSSSGHRELGEVLQRHDFRNKSSSATSSSINNDEDRSYKWNKTTSDTLSSDFIIVSKLPTTATTTASSNNSNHVKQNNSKVITTSYQPHQSLHTPKSETIDANMYPYENRCMIPPPPESPPPPSPKYNHDENHNINNNCSTIENGEHYELTSEFSSTSSSSHSPYPPNLTSNEIKHSTPKYTIAKTKHEEPEQNSKFSSTTISNIKNSHFNNNSHTHDQHAYYSKFTSSEVEDEEVDSDANHLKIAEHEERIPNSKNSFNESKHHFNSSNHQHYSRNPPICTTEKQSVLQRPVMLLSEHNLSNSPQSSFCMSLSPEEHSSSTYAQVY